MEYRSNVMVKAVKKATDLINEEEAIEFLIELIKTNSMNPPGKEIKVAEAIQRRFKKTGIDTTLDEVAEDRANLFVTLPGERGTGEKNIQKVLTYSGHLDTVPLGNEEWHYDPLGGVRDGNLLFGRGASDMKGGVAAMLLALEYLHRADVKLKGKLRFVGSVGEEVECFGAKEIVRKGQIDDTTAMIISEPSANQLFCAHKGDLQFEIIVKGKTAHGSMPEHGINSIQAMCNMINELNRFSFVYDEHYLLGGPTINIGTIEGGIKPNVVPDKCIMKIDIRTVPGQSHEHIFTQVNNLLQNTCDSYGTYGEITVLVDMPAVTTSEEDPFTKLALKTLNTYLNQDMPAKGVKYFTDGSVFYPHLKVPILVYGPGEPTMAHQTNEWIEVDKYLESIRFFIVFAAEYLGVE
ncbi:M20 family peptidase [Peribacillus cavernae]|uniref:M20 family peptidase n=1 Tax=Peribacillus cavernae TaxID=1674310 RepID=A0A433HBM4_9BACI|nr:M20 family metallopeptidase [Peribacillus cavernae]MDQ0221044.1 succinyl-diaminopimelate desuccinylase [Peribacillus cavernae]RUQ25820.1 M20 family peptidase [Peribacillus cavernae]